MRDKVLSRIPDSERDKISLDKALSVWYHNIDIRNPTGTGVYQYGYLPSRKSDESGAQNDL